MGGSYSQRGLCFHLMTPELWSLSCKRNVSEITLNVIRICVKGWGRTQTCPQQRSGCAMVFCELDVCPLGPAAAGDAAGGDPLSSRAQGKGMEGRGAWVVWDCGAGNGGNQNWKWRKPEFLPHVTEGFLVGFWGIFLTFIVLGFEEMVA